MNAMVEAIKPYIGMIFAIWFISEVITAMFRLYRKKSYQDRRMANDAEHAKVTRGNLQTLCEVCNCGKGNRYLE